MKRLLIMRHGKAEPGFTDDFNRALTEQGKKAVYSSVYPLEAAGIAFDRVLASSSKRTLSTATILHERLGTDKSAVNKTRKLYNAEMENALEEIWETSEEIGNLAMVGHNPGITELVNFLAGKRDFFLSPGDWVLVENEGNWQDFQSSACTCILTSTYH